MPDLALHMTRRLRSKEPVVVVQENPTNISFLPPHLTLLILDLPNAINFPPVLHPRMEKSCVSIPFVKPMLFGPLLPAHLLSFKQFINFLL